ncbi:MAG: hypothetical protein ACI9RU_001023 [Litorivivens sp.]|jgi:hypothetical protein
MKLIDFNQTYGTEAKCKAAFKLLRESAGLHAANANQKSIIG